MSGSLFATSTAWPHLSQESGDPLLALLPLDELAAANVKATFFLLGRHVDRWPEIARRAAADGHAIGNHGYFHRKLHVHGPAYVRMDLTKGTEAIERATGVRPRLFRAPALGLA